MSLSAADLEWFHQMQGAEPGLWLLTLTGQDLPQGSLRMVRNSVDVTSRGNLFKAAWFEPSLPGSGDEVPRVTLSIPNVDGEIGQAVADISQPLGVTLELVRPTDFDRVIVRVARLKLRRAHFDALQVTGELSVADMGTEPLGFVRMTEWAFPWMGLS